MNGDRLNECLRILRWSKRTLGEALDVSHTIVQRWGNGQAVIPSPVARWLEKLARFHEANPPPAPPSHRGPREPLADAWRRSS